MGGHADDQGAGKYPGRATLAVGDIHRNVTIKFDVAYWNDVVQKILLECETATEEEGHHAIRKIIVDMIDFPLEFSVGVDPISWDLGADVGIGPRIGGPVMPLSQTLMTGQGRLFLPQQRRKSKACFSGRMTTLACVNPGACPEVGFLHSPGAIASRIPCAVLVFMLITVNCDKYIVG